MVPVLLKGDELFGDEHPAALYDKSREISRYLLMHYGQFGDVFDRPDHPLAFAHNYPRRLSELLRSCAVSTQTRVDRALDVGCNVGGVAHALSEWVADLVIGVDISQRSIEVARSLTRGCGGIFSVPQLGPFTREVQIELPEPTGRARVEFEVGDACKLRSIGRGFDAVLVSNVLDRVTDPVACLAQLTNSTDVLRPGGLLMVACPWSWYTEFSKPGRWLGSPDGDTTSERALKRLLESNFDLVLERDEPAALRQNPREYDYFESQVTIWKRH